MKIIEDLSPKYKTYRFKHDGCCVFEAKENEFTWTDWFFNGKYDDCAVIVCPKCGKQFYYKPALVNEKPRTIFSQIFPK